MIAPATRPTPTPPAVGRPTLMFPSLTRFSSPRPMRPPPTPPTAAPIQSPRTHVRDQSPGCRPGRPAATRCRWRGFRDCGAKRRGADAPFSGIKGWKLTARGAPLSCFTRFCPSSRLGQSTNRRKGRTIRRINRTPYSDVITPLRFSCGSRCRVRAPRASRGVIPLRSKREL